MVWKFTFCCISKCFPECYWEATMNYILLKSLCHRCLLHHLFKIIVYLLYNQYIPARLIVYTTYIGKIRQTKRPNNKSPIHAQKHVIWINLFVLLHVFDWLLKNNNILYPDNVTVSDGEFDQYIMIVFSLDKGTTYSLGKIQSRIRAACDYWS